MRGIRSSKNSAVFGGASSKKEIHRGNQCALDLADKSLKCWKTNFGRKHFLDWQLSTSSKFDSNQQNKAGKKNHWGKPHISEQPQALLPDFEWHASWVRLTPSPIKGYTILSSYTTFCL